MTILREWRGRAEPEKIEAVFDHYKKYLKPRMIATPGFQGVTVGRRDLGKLVEYVLLSYWKDMDAVRLFAGPAADKAVLTEGTSDVLADSDTFVRLFEIIDES